MRYNTATYMPITYMLAESTYHSSILNCTFQHLKVVGKRNWQVQFI